VETRGAKWVAKTGGAEKQKLPTGLLHPQTRKRKSDRQEVEKEGKRIWGNKTFEVKDQQK